MTLFQILLFLDSHCEVGEKWLEPMLSTIKKKPHTVVCPIIDIIDSDTFKYVNAPHCYGGFNWGLFFKWDYPSWRDLQTPQDYIRPMKCDSIEQMLLSVIVQVADNGWRPVRYT